MEPYVSQPYTRPFTTYSRNSPSRSNMDPSYVTNNQASLAYGRVTSSNQNNVVYSANSYVDERKSIKRYSPPRTEALDPMSKPPRGLREHDVLSKANEILQRSIKVTSGGGNDNLAQKKSYAFSTNQATVSNQNLTSKTAEVLDRANEILKKSSSYSKDPSTYISDKTIPKSNIIRTEEISKETMASRPSITANHIEDVRYSNKLTQVQQQPEKTSNPRSILSRVNEALQNSNQISATPVPYEARINQPALGGTIRNDERFVPEPRRSNENRQQYQETMKRNQYGTPQKYANDYKAAQESQRYQQEKVSSGTNTFKTSDLGTRPPQGLNEAYNDALRRSQELLRRNEEELLRSEQRDSIPLNRRDGNLKSSYVMERQTNVRAASPYDDRALNTQDLSPPGIYLPAQGIKPKFVEEYYEDGTIYKGEKIRTAKHGRGEFLYADNSKYEGEWENDRKSGYGVQTFPNGNIQYDGEWKDDVFHGNGILINGDAAEDKNFDYKDFDSLENNWIKYEGEFVNGKMHGLGTLTLFNNERYVGKFKYDQVHGAGVFHKRNGETVSGEWENNKFMREV